jgi:hypothetical protein
MASSYKGAAECRSYADFVMEK